MFPDTRFSSPFTVTSSRPLYPLDGVISWSAVVGVIGPGSLSRLSSYDPVMPMITTSFLMFRASRFPSANLAIFVPPSSKYTAAVASPLPLGVNDS